MAGYKIKSRDFAESFRAGFKPYEHAWPNVSTAYGPQTLMEGWLNIDLDSFSADIQQLCYKFLEVYHLIDALLAERKR